MLLSHDINITLRRPGECDVLKLKQHGGWRGNFKPNHNLLLF